MATLPRSFVPDAPKAKSAVPKSFAPDMPASFVPDALPKSFVPDTGPMTTAPTTAPVNTAGIIGDSQLLSGLATGAAGMKESLAGSLQMVGKTLGIKSIEDYADRVRKASAEEAQSFIPKVSRLEDIHSTGDALDWAAFQLGNVFPSVTTSSAGALAGGGIGGAIGGPAGAAKGALVGAGGISYLLNAGEVYSELKEQGIDSPGAAAVAGIPMALLDVVEPTRVAGRILWKPVKGALVKRALKESVKGFATEAVTEGAQEAIGAGTVALKTGKPFLTPETFSRVLNAAAAGGLGGSAVGAAGEAFARTEQPPATGRIPPVERPPVAVESEPAVVKATPPAGIPVAVPPKMPSVREVVEEATGQPALPPEVTPTVPPQPNREGRLDPAPEPETKTEVEHLPKSLAQGAAPKVEEVPSATTPATPPPPISVAPAVSEPEAPPVPSIHEAIKAKESVFHATDVEGFEQILESGQITPGGMKDVTTSIGYEPGVTGVSVSRVPRVASKASKAISLVIDPEKMPPSRPFTEPSYGKSYDATNIFNWYDYATEAEIAEYNSAPERRSEIVRSVTERNRPAMNRTFEFENRTYGEPIPLSAVKEVLVDKEALSQDAGFAVFEQAKDMPVQLRSTLPSVPQKVEELIERIKSTAASKGLQVYVFRNGKHMAAYRAYLGAKFAKERAKRRLNQGGILELGDVAGVVNLAMDKLAAFAKHIPWRLRMEAQVGIDNFGRFSKNLLTLIQLAERNPHVEPVQRYLNTMRQWWQQRNVITERANDVLLVWKKLNVKQQRALSAFLLDIDLRSMALGRKLTDAEMFASAQSTGIDADGMEVFHMVEKELNGIVDELEKWASEEVAQRIQDPIERAAKQGEISKQYAELRNRNYFPHQRFGPHIVRVKARQSVEHEGQKFRKGQVVEVTAFESERARDSYFREAQGRFDSEKFGVATDTLDETSHAYQGFPPSLFEAFDSRLKLDESQKEALRDLYIDLSPAQSFVKHLKRRKGVRGYSSDVQRVFANYMIHAAGHVARLRYRWDLERALHDLNESATKQIAGDVAPRRDMYFAMREHHEATMNPGSEFARFKAFMFYWHFFLVPKQVLVNLTQVPIFGYSHLAGVYDRHLQSLGKHVAGSADATVVAELAAAAKRVMSSFRLKGVFDPRYVNEGYSPKRQEQIARAVAEGVLDQSFASTVAGVAHGDVMQRYLPPNLPFSADVDHYIRLWLDNGVSWFSASEQANRRVTFDAALGIAEKMGMNDESAYLFARDTTEKVNGQYAPWNRVRWARGKGSLLFLFRTFQQFTLYQMLTQPGAKRAWAMALVLAGVSGLPFAEDVEDIINFLLSTLTGKRVDIEKSVRELIVAMHMNPDLVMHGASRSSFGLHNLGKLVGVPFPALDISPSISMGRVIPGLSPIIDLLEGVTGQKKVDFATTASKLASEVGGAGASWGLNISRAAVETHKDSMRWLKLAMPAVVRNFARATEYTQGELKDSTGEALVKVDLRDPEQMAEMLGQLMGATPTRLSRARERQWAQREAAIYFMTRRELMLNQFAQAVYSRDKEVIADAKKALKDYNEDVPRQFVITIAEAVESARERFKNRRVRERGLPTQRRYLQLYKDFQKAYPLE